MGFLPDMFLSPLRPKPLGWKNHKHI